MAPYSTTDQENINNNKENYEKDQEIKNLYKHENDTNKNNLININQLCFIEKYTNEDYCNYFKEIQNFTTNMATYAQYVPQQIYNFPITFSTNDWNPILTLPTSVYTSVHQVPFVTLPQTINPAVVPSLCPCGTIITEPMITVVSPTFISEAVQIPETYYEPLVNYILDADSITSPCSNGTIVNGPHEEIEKSTPTESSNSDGIEESIECYLRLPKELFPTARMFTIDPNQIIDVFCDQKDISDHTPWLLDLEFGLPRSAVTRHIPIYDVQFNSVHCKNTPSAIHPGFERCSKGFKRELLFYYDCIVSTWYKGYVAMKNDTSVKNFQTWLLKAMQVFGMCWP